MRPTTFPSQITSKSSGIRLSGLVVRLRMRFDMALRRVNVIVPVSCPNLFLRHSSPPVRFLLFSLTSQRPERSCEGHETQECQARNAERASFSELYIFKML